MSKLRVAIPLAIILILAAGYVLNLDFGTLSAVGWSWVSVLCPLGALTTALAEHAMIPRAAISFVVVLILMIIFGRAFCAWICPVPVVRKLRGIFEKRPAEKDNSSGDKGANSAFEDTPLNTADAMSMSSKVEANSAEVKLEIPSSTTEIEDSPAKETLEPLSKKEEKSLSKSTCSSCAKKRGAVIDSRHIILGGSVLTAVVFGFPVFCFICPIGLTFASVFLVINLFSAGDLTWAVIVVPALLLMEVVFFRKWCSKICPLSAFMSLTGKVGMFFHPKIDDSKCIETTTGKPCGICGEVCPEDIDPRHPNTSRSAMSECSKCRICIEKCPSNAIKMPVWSSKNLMPQESQQVLLDKDDNHG